MKLIEYTGIHEKKTIQTINGKIVFEASDKDERKIAPVDDETAKNLLRFREFKEADVDADTAKDILTRKELGTVIGRNQAKDLFDEKPEIEQAIEKPEIEQAIEKDRERINRKAKKR